MKVAMQARIKGEGRDGWTPALMEAINESALEIAYKCPPNAMNAMSRISRGIAPDNL